METLRRKKFQNTSMCQTPRWEGVQPQRRNPEEDYIEHIGILGQVWLDNVRRNQIEAYRELLDQLFVVAHEAYPLLAEAEARRC